MNRKQRRSNKQKQQPIQQPMNVPVAHAIVAVMPDGQVSIRSSLGLFETAALFMDGVNTIFKQLQKQSQGNKAEIQDKPRQFLGPRG